VGVASDDERLILRLFDAQGFPLSESVQPERLAWEKQTAERLSRVLPDAIVVHSVSLTKSSAAHYPESAQYVLSLRAGAEQGLEARMNELMAREDVILERLKPGRRVARSVDVRPFLKAMRLQCDQAIVECAISNAGSIRVDEILTLLELELTDLAGPIRRVHTTWKTN